ncbi:MAG: PorT family protein [Odoribacter sp.]|nr:PorT family protein [Odoribacter sp.]
MIRKNTLKRTICKIVVVIIFIGNTLLSFAQKQKPINVIPVLWEQKTLHFGFSVGFNTMDFNITPSLNNMQTDSLYPEVSILNPGINIQIISGFRPSEHFEIRFLPGVSFGQRGIRFYNKQVLENDKQRLESSFLEFPLLLKYKGKRLNNIKPYLIGGLNYRYDLAGKKEYDEEKPVYLRLKRSDLYYEFGTGLDFYLPYFKLGVELKMSNGLRDVLVHDPATGHAKYGNAIEKMKSQIWIVSFHFE